MTIQTRDFIDFRDRTVYPCVLMPDGKWWSSRNLAYVSGDSYDYANNPANRAIYGRLYSWQSALDNCIAGCHVPSDSEWNALAVASGGLSAAGKHLKSTTGWYLYGAPALDTYGFTALPGGYRGASDFYSVTSSGFWWTSTEYTDTSRSYAYAMHYNQDVVQRRNETKTTNFFSVRFIVDEFPSILPPSIYPGTSTLQGVQLVTIQGQGTLRYTLDGTEPTAASPVYLAPFRLTSSATVKAKAYANGIPSETTTAVLTIQGADYLKIPSYTAATMPYLLEQYKGDNA